MVQGKHLDTPKQSSAESLLDEFFEYHFVVQADDIDALGHSNNARYVNWCEQAAWSHSASLGLGMADFQDLDCALVVSHAEYEYLLPTYERQALTIKTDIKNTVQHK